MVNMVGMVQRCSVARGINQAGSYNTVKSVWAIVAEGVPCRVDSLWAQRSRAERVSEEFVGRRRATVFFGPTANIRDRDVITVDDEQWDIEYVDKVLDAAGVHHLEVAAARRDNLLVIS